MKSTVAIPPQGIPRTIPCRHCEGKGTVTNPAIVSMQLRLLRAESGLSLRQLGKLIDKSPAYLNDIEHGRRHPTTDTENAWRVACAERVTQ